MSISEIRVCMDVGKDHHHVAIGLSTGELLEDFKFLHNSTEIQNFFNRIEKYKKQYQFSVAVAMEGYNGYARPIDKYVLARGYRLLNVNNNKLAQFKKIFPGPAKTDKIDAKKMFELFTLSEHLPLAKSVLQEVGEIPEVNKKLKYLSRRRRLLVNEKTRVINRLQSDLQAAAPGLLAITGGADNLWFLRLLTVRENIVSLKKLNINTILKVKGIGKRYAASIQQWQKTAELSPDAQWMGNMVVSDAKNILILHTEIKQLEKEVDSLLNESEMAKHIQTIPGFGITSVSELTGEIGAIERFDSESSLALYLGMAVLNNDSGKLERARTAKHVNVRAKMAMMNATARHIDKVTEAKIYYDKKRAEGKKHNQAIRSLGRHMVRVIWSMLKNNRDYRTKIHS